MTKILVLPWLIRATLFHLLQGFTINSNDEELERSNEECPDRQQLDSILRADCIYSGMEISHKVAYLYHENDVVNDENGLIVSKVQENSLIPEPQPGSILFVENNSPSNFGLEKRANGEVNIYHSRQMLMDFLKRENTNMGSYQLVGVLESGTLGSLKIHKPDYAYRPAFTALPSGDEHEFGKWWRQDYDEHNYEKIRAFAGGAIGEVWKAKRRCHQVVLRHEAKQYEKSNSRINCDENEELIMKRLLVGRSFDLLEAGLREVYFGDILSRNDESRKYFTHYVDHFYSNSDGHSTSLEMWIVFKNAGVSLRSLLYSPIENSDFVLYQHSEFWTKLRMGEAIVNTQTSFSVAIRDVRQPRVENKKPQSENDNIQTEKIDGKQMLKKILKQIITSTAKLHERGIVHRDIKPSNIMCDLSQGFVNISCKLGDLSSAYDDYAAKHFYSHIPGPSRDETTDEYSSPEALFDNWLPSNKLKPESYDSWSLGVVILELLLGTPNVFSVDKRTTAILTRTLREEKASDGDIQRALYLAALAQFCIYQPTSTSRKRWPFREGDPLFQTSMAKSTCDMRDLHSALRARDPLGIGFSEKMDDLLDLALRFLAFNPDERLSATDALEHYYFTGETVTEEGRALQPQMLDPLLDMKGYGEIPSEYLCSCGRKFDNLQSCQMHSRGRKHGNFCSYDRDSLPKCLNAHSMLPAHPTSGYCDIQGRRRTLEDFHTVHLQDDHQFYGVFDGHNSNFASKYASSAFYNRIVKPLNDIDTAIISGNDWKSDVQNEMVKAYQDLHEGYLSAMATIPSKTMLRSGTTATALFLTKEAVIISSVGDSRAVLSIGASFNTTQSQINVLQLTVDHIAANEGERKLVESLGGHIEVRGGIPRVNGTLVLTRSIGDAHLAKYLSREPNVVSMTKSEVYEICRPKDQHWNNDDMPCFIILASDGLWDVFTNLEAVELTQISLRKYGNNWQTDGAMQEAAEVLTQEAYVRGSTDNIGICIVAIV